MALAFKRSRNDSAVDRTYPNANEKVLFRDDVTNKNLLKNPFRNLVDPVGPAGVQNRPPRITTDNRGNVFATSIVEMNTGVTNKNLLQNPYRFRTDPDDDPRILTLKVIKDINSGNAPKYMRENKGVDEIAFLLLQKLQDNGVKLVTISLLKSYITGIRLNSILDHGGQHVTRAFSVFQQLVDTSKKLYVTGLLDLKLPELLLQYSQSLRDIFGDVILQDVTPMVMIAATQDLGSVSTVLSKLLNAQNSISPSTNLNITTWLGEEKQRLEYNMTHPSAPLTWEQKLADEEIERWGKVRTEQQRTEKLDPWGNKTDWVSQIKKNLDIEIAALAKAEKDNQPTGTQNIKDADSIKQDGAGKRKITYIGGASRRYGPSQGSNIPISHIPQQSQSGIIIANTNPININLTNPIGVTLPSQIGVSVKDPVSIVNSNAPLDINIINPDKPMSNWDMFKEGMGVVGTIAGGLGVALAGYQALNARKQLSIDRAEQNAERARQLDREQFNLILESDNQRREEARDARDRQRFEIEQELYRKRLEREEMPDIIASKINELDDHQRTLYEHLGESRRISTKTVEDELGKNLLAGANTKTEKQLRILNALLQGGPLQAGPAPKKGQAAAGRKKKIIKTGKGRKNKKSTNLDAQILRLLKS